MHIRIENIKYYYCNNIEHYLDGKAVVIVEDVGQMAIVLRKMRLSLMELALLSMRAMLLLRSNSETSSCV